MFNQEKRNSLLSIGNQIPQDHITVNFTSFPMPDRVIEEANFAAAGMDEQQIALAVGALVSLDREHRQDKVDMHKHRITLEDERHKFEHISGTDELTQINNRRGFSTAMESVLETAQENNDDRWSLLIVDLDKFKSVNDNFGHKVGDVYLKAIAAKLRLRVEDVLARVGGDEFAIFAKTRNDENYRRKKDISEEDATEGIKNKIRRLVEEGVSDAEQQSNTFGSNVSASIGEIPYTGVETVDELLHAADLLMLEEKNLKRRSREQ